MLRFAGCCGGGGEAANFIASLERREDDDSLMTSTTERCPPPALDMKPACMPSGVLAADASAGSPRPHPSRPRVRRSPAPCPAMTSLCGAVREPIECQRRKRHEETPADADTQLRTRRSRFYSLSLFSPFLLNVCNFFLRRFYICDKSVRQRENVKAFFSKSDKNVHSVSTTAARFTAK